MQDSSANFGGANSYSFENGFFDLTSSASQHPHFLQALDKSNTLASFDMNARAFSQETDAIVPSAKLSLGHAKREERSLSSHKDLSTGSGVSLSTTAGDKTPDMLLNGGTVRRKESDRNGTGKLKEPGETIVTARTIALTKQTRELTGEVGKSDRVDFYRFDLLASSSFNLRIKEDSNRIDMVLLNASGQVVDEPLYRRGGELGRINRSLAAGTYYVKVTGNGDVSSYQLSVSKEVGGSLGNAQLMPITATPRIWKDSVGRGDRADMYRFDLTENNTFSLNLKGLKANADMVMLDSSGKVMQSSRRFGRKDEAIGATLEAGTYYVKVIGRGRDTDYRLDMAAAPPIEDPRRFLTGDAAKTSGVFTVGSSGEVSFDYLLDGSSLQGELAIFNLKGMEQFEVGSKRYMQEAALRALGNSADSGYVVILDQTEGAKFSASAGEPNFNAGEYKGTKTFKMNPGDKFGVMLIPNGTTPDTLLKSDFSGDQHPLFSIPAANSEGAIQFTQVVDGVADGNSFAFEDQPLTENSDFDYDDLVFQMKGATNNSPLLNSVATPGKDWRTSQIGQQVEQSIFDPLDPAGNTINTARRSNVATSGKAYRGWIGGIDPDDFYSFSLGTSNSFSLSLDGLTADANLSLMDASGKVILSSTKAGNASKSINTTLSAGAYRIRVASAEDRGTPYDLILTGKPLFVDRNGNPIFTNVTTTDSDEIGYLQDIQSDPLINLNNFRSGNPGLGSDPRFGGINGGGTSVVVIDTGINLNHPFFGPDANADGISDRITFNFDYADHDADATDVNGHGTNVSSITAGGGTFTDPTTGRTVTYTGVAPSANIIHLKVFRDDSETYNYVDLQTALQWVLNNAEQFNISSVNMSLGGGNYSTPEQIADIQKKAGIGDELEAIKERGIVVASASANNYFRFTESSGSNVQGVGYPSADPNSLSIGAVWDGNNGGGWSWQSGAVDNTTGQDRVTSFSQRHSTLTTVFAPGAFITGAGLTDNPATLAGFTTPRLPGTAMNPLDPFWSVDAGTSQATPHIAGMVALSQQLAQQVLGRSLAPDEFRQLLISTGDIITDGDDENYNVTNTGLQFRRANMLALANAILDLRPPSDRNIDLSASNFDVIQQTFSAGDTIDLNFQVQNSGIDRSYPFAVNFYLSENDGITSRDYSLGDYNVVPVAGQSNSGLLTYQLKLPDASNPIWNSFKSGNAYIGMIVDGLNAVGETNENNNITSDRLQGKLTVAINRLTGDFDGILNDSDFFTLVSFSDNPPNDENLWLRSPEQTGNNITPNWKLSQLAAQSRVPITVRVYDNDGVFTFNNDYIDIDPAPGSKDLNLIYEFLTGTVSGDVSGAAGQLLGSTGAGDDKSGGIEFTVGFDPTA